MHSATSHDLRLTQTELRHSCSRVPTPALHQGTKQISNTPAWPTCGVQHVMSVLTKYAAQFVSQHVFAAAAIFSARSARGVLTIAKQRALWESDAENS
jgi:hypothetical protein